MKKYKATTVSAINAINTEAKAVAKNLSLDERIEQHNQDQTFIIDHKKHFQNNHPKCRLIHPAKTEIGIVRKHIDQINKSIREKLNGNQWRNTHGLKI